jgi:hypothetical protein
MPRRIRVGKTIAGIRFDEMQDALVAHPIMLAGSCFVLGLATGLWLKGTADQMVKGVRNIWWQRDYERTVEYDENLPESLTRREPAPDARQPRFGGTGAIGVPAAAVRTARPDESR